MTERAEKVAQHERFLAAKKRKAFAEERDKSDDEPSTSKRQRKDFNEDLLSKSVSLHTLFDTKYIPVSGSL